LSVAAISYYVVGLLGYLMKGAQDLGYKLPPPWTPDLATAAVVPIIVLLIWFVVRRIRKSHIAASDLKRG
jgi:uncharacterized membrane-anchored protein